MTVSGVSALELGAGRALAYAEYGDRGGNPVLYLHGTGSCRLEAAAFDALAADRGLRVIALDRPGAGASPAQAGRRVADVVGHVDALADHLGLGRFSLAGASGGGSHVLAYAAARPERVLSAVPINPGIPGDDPELLAGCPPRVRLLVRTARRSPRAFRLLTRPVRAVGRDFAKVAAKRPASHPDAAVLAMPEVVDLLSSAFAEGMRLNPDTFADEALMIWRDSWAQDLASIPVPVHVFSAEHDDYAPFAARLARDLAQGSLHTFPGGHMSFMHPDVRRDVVNELAAAAA